MFDARTTIWLPELSINSLSHIMTIDLRLLDSGGYLPIVLVE